LLKFLSKCVDTFVGLCKFLYRDIKKGGEERSKIATSNRSKKSRKNGKYKVVTFGSASILTVPNKLGSDSEKLFDHGLLKKNIARETSA
jgi:hypothetical protein